MLKSMERSSLLFEKSLAALSPRSRVTARSIIALVGAAMATGVAHAETAMRTTH
jgi:hypothetical protein